MDTEINAPLENIDDGMYFILFLVVVICTHTSSKQLKIIKIEIKGAMHTLKAASMPIKLSNIVSLLSNYIIDAHDGQTSLFTYKGIWINRIVSVLRSTNTEFVCSF